MVMSAPSLTAIWYTIYTIHIQIDSRAESDSYGYGPQFCAHILGLIVVISILTPKEPFMVSLSLSKCSQDNVQIKRAVDGIAK